MNSHSESTSNSIKFAPMPMSALLANLMPLQTQQDSPDNSDGSDDDEKSDNSTGKTIAKQPPSPVQIRKEFSTPSLKISLPKEIKVFASEKKISHNKENSDDIWSSNQTYPSKENVIQQSAHKERGHLHSVHKENVIPHSAHKENVLHSVHKEKSSSLHSIHKESSSLHSIHKESSDLHSVHKESSNLHSVHKENVIPHRNVPNPYPNSDVKKRSILMPHDNNARLVQNITNSAHKRTPEAIKPPSSNLKKTVTPKIKSGIRKFTPGSGRHSNKKTPLAPIIQNRDKVRCELFTQSKNEEPPRSESLAPPVMPAPETPMNRKPLPASYAVTPSYPQNVVGGNHKLLFKTTVIKDKKYMFIKKLGTGGSSEVYKVLEVGTSSEYAVKCVYLATDHELAQGYINEVRLLRELQNSDRVIRLYDYEYDRVNQLLRMVLEVGETDLSSFLRARGAGLPPALVLHYWEEMLHAVNHIHENGVIHADLKPANFLLVSGRLKLIDFGIASAISSDATSVVRSQATGTYSYISPEALMGGAGGYGAAKGDAPIKISFRSDVWSLGCILYSMVYGRTPFGHIPNLAKLAAILDPNHRIEYPPVEHLPSSLISALKWCLTYNARSRPTVRQLLSIPYLQPAASMSPLPQTILDKLQTHLTPQEYRLLMQRLQ